MPRIPITGNTYPVKDQLKALGARWNAEARAWMIDPSLAEQAQEIVRGAGPKVYTGPAKPWKPSRANYCANCGDPYRRGQICWETGLDCVPGDYD